MTTLTDEERKQRLASLGLPTDGDSLANNAVPARSRPKADGVRFAPEGVDPHTMAVTDIVFTDAMLDGFPDLTGQGFKAAGDFLFAQYKSPRRDPDRHSLLHRRITEFVGQVKRSRKTGGLVRERIKATAEQRDIAAVLAAEGINAADLAALIKAHREGKA